MKSHKKILNAAVLACALAVGLSLTACSSNDSGAETSSTTNGSSTSEAVIADIGNMDFDYTDREKDPGFDAATATKIALNATESSIDGNGATVEGSTITISAEGTYVISGELPEGQIVVDADGLKVQLVLDGVEIYNPTGPALYVKDADKVFVTLSEGSVNRLSDGSAYELAEGEDEPNATIYSKADLAFNGSGTLEVQGQFEHAVNSKDDLVITGGTYKVTAVSDALRGKDCVKALDGTFDIAAGGDGIKSSNDEDTTRGFVSIDGGTFSIKADDEGVDAYTYFRVMDGTLAVDSQDDALHSSGDGRVAGGTITVNAGDDAFHTEYNLTIDGGAIDIQSCTEGFEGQKVYINDGESHITSSDDAINAASPETTATASTDQTRSTATTTQASSGAAPTAPTAFDGTKGGTKDRMQGGADPMADANDSCLIQINGGYVAINAGGDGIDSNGYVEINGGVVLVEGPANSADGVFDYGLGATVTGGTVLMVGQSGMAQGFSSGTQPFAMVHVSGAAGQSLALTDSEGAVLASFTPQRAYQLVVVSAPGMVDGETYQLVTGGTVANTNEDGFASSGTASGGSAVSFVASTQSSGMGMGMGGLGKGGMAFATPAA